MHEIDSASATDDNHFTEGDPTIPVPATVVTADWLNAVQEEIVAVIEGAGITLNKESNDQLNDALEIMLAQWTPDATTTVAGILKLATSALALAGVDDSTAMTPALVKAVVDACRASADDMTTGTSTTKFPSVAQLVEALNDSADTNLSNVTATGTATAIGWGMPDYDNAVSITSPYTALVNGFISVGSYGGSTFINDVRLSCYTHYTPENISIQGGHCYPIGAEDIMTSNGGNLLFIPCKGVIFDAETN